MDDEQIRKDNRFASWGFGIAVTICFLAAAYVTIRDEKAFRQATPIVHNIDSIYKARMDSLDHTVLGIFGDSTYFVRKDSMIKAHDTQIDALRKVYERTAGRK